MNEFSIIMAKMSNFAIDPETGALEYKGITTEELCTALNLHGKLSKITLFNKIASFSQYINLLGMEVKQNPFNRHWFIANKSDLDKLNQTNPFENRPKLGATLYAILALILTHRKEISIDLIKQHRKKQSISNDLKQLALMNFIILTESNKVTIHPNLGYFLDFSKLLDSFNTNTFED